ncbi:dynein beta chain, ciliary-like, partial [Bombus pyrosoma]|uniref:dynein beta chain, ciliary-like n=1 Tax=Bombus pyrosoma TaxID=396416 RepID=UPI001CB907EC
MLQNLKPILRPFTVRLWFSTQTVENLFKTLLGIPTRTASDTASGDISKEDKIKGQVEDLLDKLPEEFNVLELYSKAEDRTPFVIVALQECEQMNLLCELLRRSLQDLDSTYQFIFSSTLFNFHAKDFAIKGRNFHNVSLDQGQEPVVEEAIEPSGNEGEFHWVTLQNVHLTKKRLSRSEKKIGQCSENPHNDYRLFISVEPSPYPHESIIPQGILESAIKITNEPPSGIQSNIHKALDNFTQETLESCSKQTEFKVILFALCYYRAVLAERRKFGAQVVIWNRDIKAGVPQGSVLGPILYTLYTADIPTTVNSKTLTFADDTVLLTRHANPETAAALLQEHITKIGKWLQSKQIKANTSKCNHITFTLRKGKTPDIQLNGAHIAQTKYVKYLGIHLDTRLTWKHHIKSITNRMREKMKQMYWLIN